MSLAALLNHLATHLPTIPVVIADNVLEGQLIAFKQQAAQQLFDLLKPRFTDSDGRVRGYPLTANFTEASRPLPDFVYRAAGSTAMTYRSVTVGHTVSFVVSVRAATYAELVALEDDLTQVLRDAPLAEVVDAADGYESETRTYLLELEIEVSKAIASIILFELNQLGLESKTLCPNRRMTLQYGVLLSAPTYTELQALRSQTRERLIGHTFSTYHSALFLLKAEPLAMNVGSHYWFDQYQHDSWQT